MNILAKTLLTTSIARQVAILNLAHKIQNIDEVHQEIEGKLNNSIAALEKALISVKALDN